MKRQKRQRDHISRGIYEDASGIAIRVSVRGKPREFRHDLKGKPYKSYSKSELREERKHVLARELQIAERQEAAADTFPNDVLRFLRTIHSDSHKQNTRGYMAHWERVFGDRVRDTITELDAQTAYAAIHKANSTRRHIRHALIQFYEALNGKSGYNPARALTPPPKDEEQVRDLPWADIERIFAALQPSKSKVRLMVIAYVGLPHKLIKSIRPTDLRLDQREIVVSPRRKGAGVSGRVIQLSDLGVAVLKEFVRIDAFGSFQNRQLANTFHHGADEAGVTLPDDARPYDLRHSFLTEVARGGADIRDIAHLGIHSTLAQAARYVKGAAAERATKAIAAVPRFSATKKNPDQRNPTESNGATIQSSQRKKTPRKGRSSSRMRS